MVLFDNVIKVLRSIDPDPVVRGNSPKRFVHPRQASCVRPALVNGAGAGEAIRRDRLGQKPQRRRLITMFRQQEIKVYLKKLSSDEPNSTIRRAARHPKPGSAFPKLRLRTVPASLRRAVSRVCGREADKPLHRRGVLRSSLPVRRPARARR